MEKGNLSPDFRMKKVDETRNYLLEKVKNNDLMSKKRKKRKTLNYFEHFLVLFVLSVNVFQFLILLHKSVFL